MAPSPSPIITPSTTCSLSLSPSSPMPPSLPPHSFITLSLVFFLTVDLPFLQLLLVLCLSPSFLHIFSLIYFSSPTSLPNSHPFWLLLPFSASPSLYPDLLRQSTRPSALLSRLFLSSILLFSAMCLPPILPFSGALFLHSALLRRFILPFSTAPLFPSVHHRCFFPPSCPSSELFS